MSSYYRQQLEEWLAGLDVCADRVIDVGGAQKPIKGRTKSWKVPSYAILDLAKPHEGSKPDIAFNLCAAFHVPIEPADVVFCLEVMEYVHDPCIAMLNLRDVVKSGGLLYITFPYFYPPHEPYENDCLRYTRKGAERLLTESGFSVLNVHARTACGAGLNMAVRENGLRPSKKANEEETWGTLGFIITAQKV